ncbi:Insertion element IS476 uncharacterized 39 protein [Nymphon striatum]|nr:Insertion element IS476 uncharacterized 39 protein [Nymphon striatum]
MLREIEVHLSDVLGVLGSCREVGVPDKTYYYWRKKFSGMGRFDLSEMKSLQKENVHLKKILADLKLDKLILKERLDQLKPPVACNRLPGNAWENGYNERFNGTLRQEILNAEWFHTIKQAQVAITIWLKQYNHIRPHQALDMPPPMSEAMQASLLEKYKITSIENWDYAPNLMTERISNSRGILFVTYAKLRSTERCLDDEIKAGRVYQMVD